MVREDVSSCEVYPHMDSAGMLENGKFESKVTLSYATGTRVRRAPWGKPGIGMKLVDCSFKDRNV